MTYVVNEVEINRAAADPYLATRNPIDGPVACNEEAADGYGVDRGFGQSREVGVSIMERGEADLYRSDAPSVLGVAMGEGNVSVPVVFKGGCTPIAPESEFSFVDLEEVRDVEEDTRLGGVVLSDGVRVSHGAAGNWMNEFALGDMVWGKVKSHPWWPGLIFSEEFASPSVRRTKREGHVLVAFFGDSSYGWFDPAELIPFEPNYDEKSKQTTLRPFVKAVEEAADETGRREALALICYCRNKFNIRPARVPGYLHVDVPGFEPGGIYSAKQIDTARDKFVPEKTLRFLQQASMNPVSDAIAGVDGIKSVAMLLSYRRAVFEEFDETYAQAFGGEPVLSSHLTGSRPEHTERFTSRAPLSGPLVLPEPLRHRKSANNNKLPAAKVGRPPSTKKNKYVLKRRDEQEITNGSVGPPRPVLPDFSSATQPYRNYFNLFPPQQQPPTLVFQDASSPGGSNLGDYVLQKRSPAAATDEKPSPVVAPQEFRDRPLQEQKPVPMAVDIPISSPRSASAMTVIEPGKLDPVVVSQTAHAKDVALLAPHADGSKLKGATMVAGGVPKQKKSKIRPREDGSSVAPDGAGEAKKKKKKRTKEQSSDAGQLPDLFKMSKIEDLNKKPAEKPINIGSESLKRGDGVARIAEPFTDTSQLTKEDVSFRNPQLYELVGDLKELALDPFFGLDRDAPLDALHVFLKFRSLVYQKSLALPLASEAEALEVQTSKSSAARPAPEGVAGGSQTAPTKDMKEDREPPKPAKASFRSDDPTVAGRKRILLDRQEEMSVKKPKKLEKLKALPADKKATISQKGAEALPRDQKEGGGTTTSAAVVPAAPTKPSNKVAEFVKKQEPPPRRLPSPTTLVMKFPPNTTLPSVASLKARFARFGPLELTGTRVYWQSNTCKVVYKFKSDAEAALNYGRSNKIFGEVKVHYYLRDAESAADPFTDAGVQQPGSRPTEVAQFRPGSGGSGSGISFGQSKPLFNPDQKPAGQLKSILKKPGDEAGPSIGTGCRDAPRVKFMLDGVNGKVPATVAGGNSTRSNADAPTSSSLPPLDPIVSKPPKSVSFLPPPQPLSLSRPIHSYPSRVMDNPYHPPPSSSAMPPPPALIRVADRFQSPPPLIRNIDNTESRGPVPSRFGEDQPHSYRQQSEAEGRGKADKEFASQMLSLLVRCSDIVTNVKSAVGYVPYHPL